MREILQCPMYFSVSFFVLDNVWNQTHLFPKRIIQSLGRSVLHARSFLNE